MCVSVGKIFEMIERGRQMKKKHKKEGRVPKSAEPLRTRKKSPPPSKHFNPTENRIK